MAKTLKKVAKKRKVKVESDGKAFIQATFNNIIVTVTNRAGQVISWASAGKAGFKGSKKNTPYAAQVAASSAAQEAYDAGMRSAEVFVKGPGAGREAAIRAIDAVGVRVKNPGPYTCSTQRLPSTEKKKSLICHLFGLSNTNTIYPKKLWQDIPDPPPKKPGHSAK